VTPGIATEGLGKRFGSVWALRDCSITVPSGAVAGLVGGNGAGKTTLLRALAGLARPSAGRATVAGTAPADDPTFLEKIGYLAQDVPLYRRWTAEDHLAMAAHLNSRWDDAAARDRLLGLRIPLDRRVESLSGGMRAQVALAVALGKRPEVLLLDEPLAALDPFARHEFMGSLAGAIADHPVTVLLSSHLLPDLERVCDHLVLLDRAETVLCGAIDDLVDAHRVVTAPASARDVLELDHFVVSCQDGRREINALVRVDGPVVDPRWRVDAAGLEEIVLAYLGRSAPDAPLPRLAGVGR
jgi:ABC-2 type transport system ATP-binding protein